MEEPAKKKRRMPRGMYVGSAWIGFSILMFLCWFLSVRTSRYYIAQGIGDPANFRTILALIAIFGFALPMLIGIRTLRRTGRAAREAEQREREGT